MKFKILIYCLIAFFSIHSCKKDKNNLPPPAVVSLNLDSLKTLTTDLPAAEYADLTFVTSSIGYAIAPGKVAKTTNGGINWKVVNFTENTPLKKIQFIDNLVGFIIGGTSDTGVLLKTTDAGLTWNKMDYGGTEPVNGMFFLNKDIGFLVGRNIFCKTVNGGLTWSAIKSVGSQIFNDINFKNNLEGIVSANNGVYYLTSNGGIDWTVGNFSNKNNLGKIYFTENKELISISSDTLVNVRNKADIVVTPTNAHKLLFINAQQIMGVGSHYEQSYWPFGDIMVSNNGAKTFTQKSFPISQSISFDAISLMGKNRVMMIGIGFDRPLVVTLNL